MKKADNNTKDNNARRQTNNSLRFKKDVFRQTTWLLVFFAGLSALGALAIFIINFGDITNFVQQAANAKAGPLFGAIAAQCLPYLLASYIWLTFLRKISAQLAFVSIIPLSFAKLFADQALPTGGLSGAAFFLFALTRRGVSDKAAFRTFAFTTSAYFIGFLIAAIFSLILLAAAESAPPALSASVATFAGIFVLLTILIALVILYRPNMAPAFLRERPIVTKAIEFANAALRDIKILPGLFAWFAFIFVVIRIVDGFTLMMISHAINGPITLTTGFVAVAIASITATIGPVPMGVGTFEAGMIATLVMFGSSMEDALTSTLIYRGLTLWLPLLPGFLILQQNLLHSKTTSLSPNQEIS